MITKETVKKLEVIFSDAYLLDIDFSQWDMNIKICVAADHYPGRDGKSGPVVLLSFRRVWKMDFSFNHHDYFSKNPSYWRNGDRFKWPIYRCEIEREVVSKLFLSGAEQFPTLTIAFEDVDFEEVDRSVLAEVNPAWGKAQAGLARPGIMELQRLISAGRK